MIHRNITKPAISEAKRAAQFKLVLNALHDVLCAVFKEDRPADRVLSAFFRANPRCGSRDRREISEIVYAVWRNWGFLRRTLSGLEELEAGSRAPTARELESLACGGVYLADLAFPAAHLAHLELPPPAPNVIDRARKLLRDPAVQPSLLLPDWVKKHVEPDFPLEVYAERLMTRPPMWLRDQSGDRKSLLAELAAAGLAAEPHPAAGTALEVRAPQVNLFTLPAYCEGRFEVQDLASQCIGLAAAPAPGERWWDACAGAGGKSLQLAQMMNRKGTVVASDIREYKLEDLRKRARRAGFPNIQTRAWDGKALRPNHRGSFDGVLVDAPCSCSGVWRRNPDGVWTTHETEIAETAALQAAILEHACAGVKPGGLLIYATCSVFREENREQVTAFLKRHPEFVQERFPHPLTGGFLTDGMLQITPADADCDAMFAARLRRLKGNA